MAQGNTRSYTRSWSGSARTAWVKFEHCPFFERMKVARQSSESSDDQNRPKMTDSREHKTIPRWPKDQKVKKAPKTHQEAPRRLQDDATAPRRSQDGLGERQDSPKTATRRPKTVPRRPPDAPRRSQDGLRRPKVAHGRPQNGPRQPKMAPEGPKTAQDGPKTVPDGPKTPPDSPKTAQDIPG